MAVLRPNSAISMKIGKHTWQTKYHTYVSRVRNHDQKVLDVESGGVSLAHIAHDDTGYACLPKTRALRGCLTRQWSAKKRHHNRRETSQTTLTSFISPSFTHFISPFSLRWQTRQVRRHLPPDPVPLFYSSQGLPL